MKPGYLITKAEGSTADWPKPKAKPAAELRIARRLKQENPDIDPGELDASLEQVFAENPDIAF